MSAAKMKAPGDMVDTYARQAKNDWHVLTPAQMRRLNKKLGKLVRPAK